MRHLLFLLGIVSIFFAQSMSAQMDDVGTGEAFPTADCKVASKNFARNLKAPGIVFNPEDNIYRQLIDGLNTVARAHDKTISKLQTKLQSAKADGKKSVDSQIAIENSHFNREKETLLMSCGEYILWINGSFEKNNTSGAQSMGSKSPKGKN